MPVAPPFYTRTIRFEPPAAIVAVAERLERAGFETWCVGGAVRDALLGVPHSDWDLATAALPRDVQRLFARAVPVGIEHGTVCVLGGDGRMHEVTTLRADVDGIEISIGEGRLSVEHVARSPTSPAPRDKRWRALHVARAV